MTNTPATAPAHASLSRCTPTPMPPPMAASTHKTATAVGSESPIATSRCEEWSRPPSDGRRPDSTRATTTNVVSKIGMNSTMTGAAITASSSLGPASTAGPRLAMASTIPTSRLPASPMKIDAGCALYTRKAHSAPSSVASSCVSGAAAVPRTSSRQTHAIAPTPVASPSMLSSRLNALVMPTIQTSVSSVSTVSESDQWRRWPAYTMTEATTI